MDTLLRLRLFVSALAFCAALPAPDATTSAPTVTGTPIYVDTIQSIQCIGTDKIRLSFQNQYSFMDAWDWGCMCNTLLFLTYISAPSDSPERGHPNSRLR